MRYGRYNRQGYFAECFVEVLAASAGLVAATRRLDFAGVDFTLELPGNRGTTRYPKMDVQVKSWSSPQGNAAFWQYRMRAEHFNDIAGPGFENPRYLFLVIVPDAAEDFTSAAEDALRLRHCAYWVSLADEELVDPRRQATVTVAVPRRNVLTAAVLPSLLRPLVAL